MMYTIDWVTLPYQEIIMNIHLHANFRLEHILGQHCLYKQEVGVVKRTQEKQTLSENICHDQRTGNSRIAKIYTTEIDIYIPNSLKSVRYRNIKSQEIEKKETNLDK